MHKAHQESVRQLQEASRRAQEAVDHLERLQNLTATLSEAITTHQVADVIIEHGLAALRAQNGVIALLSEDGSELINLRIVGYPKEICDNWRTIPTNVPMAIPDAVRSGRLIVLQTWEERVSRYPTFSHVRANGANGALVAIPLLIRERAIGAIGLGFPTDRVFSSDERRFMLSIGQQCALALDRARLFDAERCARQQAHEEIAQRERAEQALAANEARFRSLIENALDIISIVDVDGTIKYQSPSVEQVLGYGAEELAGKSALDLVHPDDLPAVADAFGRILSRAGATVGVEYRFRHKNGHWRLLESIGRNALDDAAVGGIVINSRDITERQSTEEALLASYRQTEEILDSITDAFYAVDADFRFTFINRKAEQLWGKSYTDLIGKHYWTLFPNAVGSESYEAHLRAAVTRQAEHFETISPIVCRWVEVSIYPTNDGGLSVYFRDISERRRTEDALRESEERYRSLTTATTQIVWTTDATGAMADREGSWQEFTGQTADEYSGWGWIASVHPEDRPRVSADWKAALDSGAVYTCEYRLRHRNGSYRNTVARAAPIRDSQGNIKEWIGTNTDITERVQHLAQIETLNVRLKRSIQETHHRVKNNLQVISALAELQIDETSQTVPVSAIERIGQHARSLAAIHDLLTQQAKVDAQIETISTAAAMERLITLLQSTTDGRTILCSVRDARLSVQDGTSLALLVSELVSNATKHGAGEIEVTFDVEGNTAKLEVCDDGCGFPPDFDPRTAANTGLNLIDSTGRYELRGSILYQNRPEGGARVSVTFPIAS